MKFIDSHCHLDFSELSEHLASHIHQAHHLGIESFIVPGVTLAQCEKLVVFQAQHESVKIALGLHPYFMAQHSSTDFNALIDLAYAHRDKLVAIGESGIDGQVADLDAQRVLFCAHIKLANELSLPLIVHHRQSHHLIAQSFKEIKPLHGGVIHAFSGSLQQAQYYIKMGFKLGVGGTITYDRARKTRQVIAQCPLDSLLLETDAPSMPLFGYQGEVNVPKRLIEVFSCLDALRGESSDFIAQTLYENTCNTFQLTG